MANPETIEKWLPQLACVRCSEGLEYRTDHLSCPNGHHWPIADGTVRCATTEDLPDQDSRQRTADSFAFEWEKFGSFRAEWRRNFFDYMHPHEPGFFAGLRMLDAGTGSGRHAREAALLGASVVAVDLGPSIDVARRNVPQDVLTVQCDLERLPLRSESFDFVCSIGVLHHLPNPQSAVNYLVRFVKPGGRMRVYLYWQPVQRSHRWVLRRVSTVRRLSTRLPHRVLLALCYPISVGLWCGIVMPYRFLRRFSLTRRIADALPLKTYADYPFGVLVNDQFDRFSAPIEHRYTAEEVETMLRNAGLRNIQVFANSGWLAEGVKPHNKT